jgi:hypothetical protein
MDLVSCEEEYVANELSQEVLQRLARLGAQARLEQIDAERRAIMQAFPDLTPVRRGRKPGRRRGRPAKAAKTTAAAPAAAAAPASRRKSNMSAAARRAVSERMKKYWAERRKAKAKE